MTQTQTYSWSDWSRTSPHASPFIVRCARLAILCRNVSSGESARERQAGSGVELPLIATGCNRWPHKGSIRPTLRSARPCVRRAMAQAGGRLDCGGSRE
jgi:hypothetical protein